MDNRILTPDHLAAYRRFLNREERAPATVEKYLRDVSAFAAWLGKRPMDTAGVAPSKVFPHNLRHLLAMTFYRATRDIVQLADLLGHSSVNTTRIYLATAGAEHIRRLEQLGLVS